MGNLCPGQSTLDDFQRRFDPMIDQLNTSGLKHHPSREPRRAYPERDGGRHCGFESLNAAAFEG